MIRNKGFVVIILKVPLPLLCELFTLNGLQKKVTMYRTYTLVVSNEVILFFSRCLSRGNLSFIKNSKFHGIYEVSFNISLEDPSQYLMLSWY